MNKAKIGLVAFFALAFLAGAITSCVNLQSHKEKTGKITREIGISGLKIEKTKDNHVLLSARDDFQFVSMPGQPRLPYRILNITVPYDAIESSIKVSISNPVEKTEDLKERIAPAQKNWIDPEEKLTGAVYKEEPKYQFDKAVYERNEYSPKEHVRVLEISQEYDKALGPRLSVRILFSPVLYNPATNQIKVLEKGHLEIQYSLAAQTKSTRGSRTFDYIIVTTKAILNGSTRLCEFAQHKEIRGFSVRIITEDDYDKPSGIYPDGRAERIRSWLQRNYVDFGIEYVLLIGNPDPDDPMYSNDQVGDLPMKQIWHGLPGEMVNGQLNQLFHWGDATDWYYADLSGDWDANDDGLFGERPWLPHSQVVSSPRPSGDGTFSVRWKGTFDVPTNGVVKLALKQRKGSKVLIDGTLLYDHWNLTPRPSAVFRDVTLASGAHQIEIQYRTEKGRGHVLFQYQLPGQDQWTTLSGLTGQYYPNDSLSGTPAATLNNETIKKNWESSDYAASGGANLDAEVAVGRIPVYDNDYGVLDKILVRTMQYERGDLGTSWQHKSLLAMRSADDGTPGYDLGEAIFSGIFERDASACKRIYNEDYGVTPPPDLVPVNPLNVVNTCNDGIGILVWFAHGTLRWADQVLDAKYHLPASAGQSPKLNGVYPAFTFQASCHNGAMYVPDCYPTCPPNMDDPGDGRVNLAYQLLRQVSVATVAASEVSTYAGGAFQLNRYRLFNQDFAYLYTEQIVGIGETAGVALRKIKYNQFSNPNIEQSGTYHQQLIFNLYGDPSLEIASHCVFESLLDTKANVTTLAGLWSFKRHFLDGLPDGPLIARAYYRGSLELEKLLKEEPKSLEDAMGLMAFFSDLGDKMEKRQQYEKLWQQDKPVLNDDIKQRIDQLYGFVSGSSSDDLKKDLSVIFKLYKNMEKLRYIDLLKMLD